MFQNTPGNLRTSALNVHNLPSKDQGVFLPEPRLYFKCWFVNKL